MDQSPFSSFHNEPDTDWSLPHHSEWAESIIAAWKDRCDGKAIDVPLVIGGQEIAGAGTLRDSLDPSRPGTVVARYHQATEAEVERAIACAREDADGWRQASAAERRDVLHRAADELQAARGELLGAMMAEGGKLFTESDPEVSEAVDFCRFYSDGACYFHALAEKGDRFIFAGGHSEGSSSAGAKMDQSPFSVRGQGVAVVLSPWNFPLAIPCGGVAAALAAGNTVILKPASDTVLIAYLLCDCLWRAGVPKTALQFAPCRGDDVAQKLVTHDEVNVVVLTGGTATAAHLLVTKPTINLYAETGGKNATIVTALSDRDQVIKNVLHSAFSHSGQKCSATSLMILESEVYHDARFREAFCDAVESLRVGSAWELPTRVGPLIRPPSGPLETGLKELEPGEEWAVMPRPHIDDNPHLVSPGVKWGVQPGSFTHMTELFGPVLGVMEAGDLDEAIELVNATGYGLTSGLESLDDREQEVWRDRLRAGNLYINRPTTGAIVLRQPFGGMGKSNVGPGIKAGGPNYVVPLMRCDDHKAATAGRGGGDSADGERDQRSRLYDSELRSLSQALDDLASAGGADGAEIRRVLSAIESYTQWARDEFHAVHDHFRLLGEDNFRRYLPVEPLRLRVHPDDTLSDLFCRAAAARAAGCRATVSLPPSLAVSPPSRGGQESPTSRSARGTYSAADAVALLDRLTDSWAGAIEFVEEDDARLAEVIRAGQVARVRYAAPVRVPSSIRTAAAESLQWIADLPVSLHGRIELLWYFREQSISHLYHRYGNLGRRAEEPRSEPE